MPEPAEPMTAPPDELRLGRPSPEELFCPKSDAAVRQLIRAEAERNNRRVEFPPQPPREALGPGKPMPPPLAALVVPSVLCYRPLYFEDRNTERYGWWVPCLQPFLSTGKFYLDTVLLPYHLLVQPPWSWQCSQAVPKPGDHVPYVIDLPLFHGMYRQKGGTVEAEVSLGAPAACAKD
jgi:hypothetical protein